MLRRRLLDDPAVVHHHHPVGSFAVADGGSVDVPFAAASKRVEAAGFKGDSLLQRRRVAVKP